METALAPCGHPVSRGKQKYRADGRKSGWRCTDCEIERKKRRKKDFVLQAMVGDAVTSNSFGRHQQEEAMKRLLAGAPPERLSREGLCGGDPVDDRYTMDPKLLTVEDEEQMARACEACPVWNLCLVYFRTQPHFEGVAGGEVFTGGSGSKRLRRPLRRIQKEAVA